MCNTCLYTEAISRNVSSSYMNTGVVQYANLGQVQTACVSCRHTIQKYRCPRCERSYTSLDIASFPIREFGFQCGECSEEGYDVSLHESFHSQDGAMIDVKEKDQRVAAAKQMLVIPNCPLLMFPSMSSVFAMQTHADAVKGHKLLQRCEYICV